MIMKVFGIIVNRRNPCTKEQAERGDETEKYCGLAQCGALQYFGHQVGHTRILIVTRFVLCIPEQSDSCICWPVKGNAGLYVQESHYTVVFQDDTYIFKTTFHHDHLNLAFATLQRR